MDRKAENKYNMNFSNKNDNMRHEMPFQNMMINSSNIFQFRPMPNIVLIDRNFLNKKREGPETSSTDMHCPGDKNKRKYYTY